MPITPYLKGQAFDPDHVRAMGIAFENVCAHLKLSGAACDGVTELVAAKVVDLALTGERDPDRLSTMVLKGLTAVD